MPFFGFSSLFFFLFSNFRSKHMFWSLELISIAQNSSKFMEFAKTLSIMTRTGLFDRVQYHINPNRGNGGSDKINPHPGTHIQFPRCGFTHLSAHNHYISSPFLSFINFFILTFTTHSIRRLLLLQRKLNTSIFVYTISIIYRRIIKWDIHNSNNLIILRSGTLTFK